ncbi:MAG: ribonuclease III [Pseudomonadota bacterium]
MGDARHPLELKLGHIFSDVTHLTRALTHRSFGVPHNERLEFLGDGLLNLAIAKLIYENFPAMPEGDLSRLRANLVNQTVLAQIATDLGLGAELRLGEGELKTGGASRPSILADAVESLIGAVFVDAGFDAANSLVVRLFCNRIEDPAQSVPTKDPKSKLQEWLQGKRQQLPQYMVKRIEGAAHQQMFYVECITERPAFKVEGCGITRRAAEQDAAAKVLAKLALHGTSIERGEPT